MKLPANQIGVSDLKQYLECPRRFAFGMRRHTKRGESPEAQSPAAAYGSAIHDVLSYVQEGLTDEEAVQKAFQKWGGWLEPADVDRLFRDLETYYQRRPSGFHAVANEKEVRIPLLDHDGKTIYFRCRLDRLYQSDDDPGRFIYWDYKSSRYAKTQEEVDEDVQLWAYAWAIHEYWPECEDLTLVYDQLRYGMLRTRRSPEQLDQIKQWLQTAARAVLADRDLKPRFNQFCPWCPISGDCPVPRQLSDYALSRIATLAPARKEGRKKVIDLDPTLYDVYVRELPKMDLARKTLEKVSEAIRTTVKDMPEEQRQEYGFSTTVRGGAEFTPVGLKLLHERLGDDDFYDLIGVAKSRLQSRFRGDPETLNELLGYMEERDGATILTGGPVDSS